MKNKIVRIKDIAEKAGVSAGTVDRVLHNRGKVAEEVRQKILAIVEELNYRPNYEARALGSNKKFSIAALIPDYTSDPYWYDPKLGIDSAEKELAQYGLSVRQYLFMLDRADSFVEKAEQVSDSMPDGVILAPVFYKEAIPYLKRWHDAGIPVIVFNTEVKDFDPLSYIGQDSYQSGRLAASLVHYGQPHPCSVLLAHIDEDLGNSTHLMRKEQGFKDYFDDNGLADRYTVKRIELKRRDYLAFIRQLDVILQSTPDLRSIFVTTSKGYEIAAYLEDRGIEHIKVVGYDLIPRNIYFINRGLISFVINQHPRGQGYWSVHQLADHLVFRKDVPQYKYLSLDIVTKENMSYFLEQEHR